jgi:hypothetical protein
LPKIKEDDEGRLYFMWNGKKKYLKREMTKKQFKAYIKLLRKKKKAKKKLRRKRRETNSNKATAIVNIGNKTIKGDVKTDDKPADTTGVSTSSFSSNPVTAPPNITTATTTRENDLDFIKSTLKNELRGEIEKELKDKKQLEDDDDDEPIRGRIIPRRRRQDMLLDNNDLANLDLPAGF